jgi:anion-transporting  ArsA/GET3 family ATPase
VTRSLIRVAPALTELAITGQITSSPRNHGPHGDHEVLVVDAYATGHFLQLIQAPKAMGETIHNGPMGDQSRQIYEVFKSYQICHLHLVATAEELPITEALELDAEVARHFNWPTEMILNRFLKTTLSIQKIPDPASTLLQQALRDKLVAQDEALKQIKKSKRQLRVFPLLSGIAGVNDLPALESL